ncbi:MAG: DUF2058 family protein [Xanthomonadales bacterium]|nr:DUF2058 family protein [Xanthomonadales bacterium]
MSESLRDQLLKAGFAPKAPPKPAPKQHGKPQQKSRPRAEPEGRNRPPREGKAGRPATAAAPRKEGEIDLAKAYALRDRHEREAAERERREAEQRARERKERRQKLAALLDGKALNDSGAEIPRHFPYGNRIRRIYVTAEQLPRLNGGELAIVQQSGRYVLVARDTALAAQAIDPDALALLCDPHGNDEDDVPPDLMW